MSGLSLPSILRAVGRRPSEAARRTGAGTVTRHYRIGAVPVSLTSGIPQIVDDFHRYYAPYQVLAPAADSFPIDVFARRSKRSLRNYFCVRANGHDQCILRSMKSVLPFIEWTINALTARFLPGYLAIHAASMSRGGRGLILAGSPGQGKSTLAAGLLAHGWSYLSDEFALIEPETGRLAAFPKALCIKAGSFEPLRDLGLPIDLDRVLHKGSKGPVSLLDPLAVRPDAVGEPSVPRLIAFPEYRHGTEPAVEPMSRAQAVFELVRSSFNFTKFRNEGLTILAGLARHAHCVRVRSGDLRQTCQVLDAYLDRVCPVEGRSS